MVNKNKTFKLKLNNQNILFNLKCEICQNLFKYLKASSKKLENFKVFLDVLFKSSNLPLKLKC